MKRRAFLHRTAAATAMVSVFPACLDGLARETAPGQLERRAYGKTGETLSIVGFSGFMLNRLSADEAAELVSLSIDRGVNYFDVAPQYGNAQELLGPPLEPHRDKVFLACKTEKRTRADAEAALNRSLKLLRTDHFDLYQFHYVTTPEDVKTILGPDGAMEAVLAARQAGKLRYIGFSAHSVEAAMALMDQFDFDGILFPVNYGTWHKGHFGPQVLARAQGKKMGIAGIKAMCKGAWPKDADRSEWRRCWYEPFTEPADAKLGLRFTLSHPVTTAFPPADARLYRLALDLMTSFEPLTAAESQQMKQLAMAGQPIFNYPRNAG